jgi:hypothetical protein
MVLHMNVLIQLQKKNSNHVMKKEKCGILNLGLYLLVMRNVEQTHVVFSYVH